MPIGRMIGSRDGFIMQLHHHLMLITQLKNLTQSISLWNKQQRFEKFHVRDLYNLQVLCSTGVSEKPTEEQLTSLKSLLGFFHEYNYNLALLRSRGDQFRWKLYDKFYHLPEVRSFVEHVDKEYKEDA